MMIAELLDFLFPRFCSCCGTRLLTSEKSICLHCNMELPRLDYHVAPDDNSMVRLFWGRVEAVEHAAALIAYYPHTDSANIVYDFKYHDRPDVARDMGVLMAQEMDAMLAGVDCLVPVPLTMSRLRQRGYNQSVELARGISRVTNIPVIANVLKRDAFYGSQTQLGAVERLENVEKAFSIKKGKEQLLSNKHIAIIDDVVTTGATTFACARLLGDLPGVRLTILSFGFAGHR